MTVTTSGSGQPPLTTDQPRLIINGPTKAQDQLILAHGAGAGSDHPFLQTMAESLADNGVRVIRFDFPYMQKAKQLSKRHPPDRMPRLLDAYRQVVALVCQRFSADNSRIWLGGKSMGGRVASLLAGDKEVADVIAGVVVLGFPFHPPGKPDRFRGEHLKQVLCPHLILQGERDPFGKRDEVESYLLDSKVTLEYVASGDHSFSPLKASGLTDATNLKFAAEVIANFMHQH